MDATDRRRHPRFRFEGPLELRPQGKLNWVPVVPADVSQGGLAFVSALPLEVGQVVRVGLRAPDADAFIVDAVVRHVTESERGYFIGVERRAA